MASLLLSIQSRLTNTSSLLLERARVLSLDLTPSASSTAQIFRTLSSLKSDISKLEDEISLEAAGLSVGGSGRQRKQSSDASLFEVQERYDRLVDMFEEDEMGREKAKLLRRERSAIQGSEDVEEMQHTHRENEEQSILPRSKQDIEPFRDASEEHYRDESSMLAEQQEVMNDQDERLNLLSHSIGRQNHLSIQIGSELDLHHDLLEETDAAMDRTAARLGRARRRLDTVANEAKQHGSTITIVLLIFILLILIIVFKT